MRSSAGGIVSASIMFIPLLAVPFLAAFGLPQFTPLAASPATDSQPTEIAPPEDSGVGESLRYTAEDIFAPFSERSANGVAGTGGANAARAVAEPATQPLAPTSDWADPFEQVSSPSPPPASSTESAFPPATNAGGAPAPDDARQAMRDWVTESGDKGLGARVSDQAAADPFGASAEAPGDDVAAMFAVANAPAASRQVSQPAAAAAEQPGTAIQMQPLTWQSAIDRLNKLGISEFHLLPEGQNRFLFSCLFHPPQNPRLTRRFEAEGDEPLQAIANVLKQIDGFVAQQ